MLRAYFANLLRLSSIIILMVLILVSVIIWMFAGRLSVGGVAAFEPALTRAFFIFSLFFLYFFATFLRHFLARRANAKLINSMLANDELVSMGSSMSADEIELIRERFENALKTLRDNPIDRRRKRDFLYDLPWYIIIGPPGTGKTTILRNSGLHFPLEADGQAALQGIGGTRNCDWWIANEAVLIDTAGRYTTQDVNQDIDAAAWGGFLTLLKEHRKRRPVNGVLLAVSIADIVLSSETERQRQAAVLRQRLRELHRAFAMRLPVYVLLTKCDLIAGFEEYFDEVAEAEREQVWGVTVPFDSDQMTFGPLFENGFLDLVSRLERRLPQKLAGERNNGRRCRIYGFPHEFASMGTVLRSFLAEVFQVNRYEAQPFLRGVYFTSGTQEGTPFDRLLGAMGRSFALAPSAQMPTSGQGKAFFIKRVLSDIIFPEQNLVGKNTRLERQLAAARLGALAAMVLFTFGLSAYWLFGLSSSIAQVKQADMATATLTTRLREAEQNRSLVNILPALDAAKTLRDTVAVPPTWYLGGFLGVDARPALSAEARKTYDAVLGNYLLPSMASRMQGQIQLLTTSADGNNLLLREQLETYLMLTTGENFARDKVSEQFEKQSEAVFVLSPADRAKMSDHITRLVSLLPKQARIDQPTVEDARIRLNKTPQANDIYRRMMSDAERRYQLPPISIVNVLGSGVLRVDTAALGGTSVVPGVYTKNGFYDFFLPRLPEYIRASTGSDWVMGSDTISNDAYNKLAEQIVAAYTKDYIAYWRGATIGVRVIDFEALNRGQTVLQELSSPQSPLTALLTVLRDNTELPLPSESAQKDPTQLALNKVKPGTQDLVASALPDNPLDAIRKTELSTAFGNAAWPGTTIGDAFRPLTSLVDPQNNADSLSQVQGLFGDMFGTIAGIATAPLPEAAAFDYVVQRAKNPQNDVFTKLRAVAATKPEPVASMVNSVSGRTWQLLTRLSYAYVNDKWQQEVLPACNAVLADRYPFALDATEEVAMPDFADLFKPSGTIDKFFTDYLTPFVTVKGGQITELSFQGASIGLSKDALAQFRRARTIRESFFGAAGTTPEAKFTVEPSFLDPKALRSSFTLDDVQLVYRHGPIRGRDYTWPSKLDSSTATLQIALLDGSTEVVERSGNWAIFRMLSNSGLARGRGQDEFLFGIEKNKIKGSFRLKANSVANPFDLGLYSEFRCPPAL